MTFELDGEVMNETTHRLEIDIVPAALSFLDRPATSGSVAVEVKPEASVVSPDAPEVNPDATEVSPQAGAGAADGSRPRDDSEARHELGGGR